MPPDWSDSLEEAQYTISQIQTQMKELTTLQNKHLLKPTFDDSMNEEKQMEELTQEITQVRILKQIVTLILSLISNIESLDVCHMS